MPPRSASPSLLSPEQRIVLEELVRRRSRPGLLDTIVQLTPAFRRPSHLEPLARMLERAVREPVELVVSLPPRHAKSETLLHWIAWALSRDPTLTFAYISYAADFAATKSRRARLLTERAGVRLGLKVTDELWETAHGGSVKSTGILGQLTGEGFRVIVVDDPIKNREEAESPTYRRKLYEGFTSDVYTRRDPRGTSVIVVQTRWHPDDLVGHLISDGWDSINLPAIDEAGRALWPEAWPLEALEKIRETVGEYTWASLYQGQPRPRGGALFHGATYTNIIPVRGYRPALGVDLAYSAKTHADYSSCVVLARVGTQLHVMDVQRRQLSAPDFASILRGVKERYPGIPTRWYCAGAERGIADLLKTLGVHVEAVQAHGDKFTRAQPVAAAWNAGRILVPQSAPWAKDFVDEVTTFTGLGDAHDDQVDALAAAYDLLEGKADYGAFVRNLQTG